MKQHQIAELMGVDLRTVQNYLSPSWLAEKGLSDLSLEGETMSEPPEFVYFQVGPVPDVPTKYVNPVGQMPTGVWVTPTTGGTHGPILVTGATPEYFELQSPSDMSGIAGIVTATFVPGNAKFESLRAFDA